MRDILMAGLVVAAAAVLTVAILAAGNESAMKACQAEHSYSTCQHVLR